MFSPPNYIETPDKSPENSDLLTGTTANISVIKNTLQALQHYLPEPNQSSSSEDTLTPSTSPPKSKQGFKLYAEISQLVLTFTENLLSLVNQDIDQGELLPPNIASIDAQIQNKDSS